MTLGSQGEDLIKSYENLKLVAYLDEGGVWTIGWGHTPAQEGWQCTAEQAEEWFQDDVSAAVRGVVASLTTNVSQQQFDALVAFTFNVGVAAEAHSTLLELVNARDFGGAAEEFLKWNHVKGRVSNGLTARREAEQQLFLA